MITAQIMTRFQNKMCKVVKILLKSNYIEKDGFLIAPESFFKKDFKSNFLKFIIFSIGFILSKEKSQSNYIS